MTEDEFLAEYNPNDYQRPSTAVDSAIFTVHQGELLVLLIKRAEHPCLGQWSLVGGYVDIGQDSSLEATALRKLRDKTSFASPYLEQVMSIGGPDRDARGWTISTIYYALIPHSTFDLRAKHGASEAALIPVQEALDLPLAFDHAAVLQQCLERLRSKTLYTTLPVYLMEQDFTLSELQGVYESILGHSIQQKSFRRRMEASGVIQETGALRQTGRRPAALYRKLPDLAPHYFVRNLESISV